MNEYDHFKWIASMLAVAVLAAAWVVTTWVKTRCAHEWEEFGEEIHVSWVGFISQGDSYKHPVRCSKCGKIRSFYV